MVEVIGSSPIEPTVDVVNGEFGLKSVLKQRKM